MKKQLSLFIFCIMLSFAFFNCKAQVIQGPDSLQQNKTDQQSKPKEKVPENSKLCVRKFKSITDTYYGIPNLLGNVLMYDLAILSVSRSYSNIGPTGVKYEFLLTNTFGIGIDANYSYATINWKEVHTDANNNPVIYSYKGTTSAFRSMLGVNYHHLVKKRIDCYSAIKVGYFSRTFSYSSDEPNDIPPSRALIWNWWHAAVRVETGARIFITPFLALNFSLGIGGGPIVAGGVSSKF